MSLKMPTPEKEVQSACIAVCRSFGVAIRRRNVAGARPFPGRDGKVRYVKLGDKDDPDLWGILPEGWPSPGRHLEIEVKRPGERPRPGQLDRLLEYQAAGAFALWTDDSSWLGRVFERIRLGYFPVLYASGTFHLFPGSDSREVEVAESYLML